MRLCRSFKVPFSRLWWHSLLDLSPNQKHFNIFYVIHEIGSIYEDLWKVAHLYLWVERFGVFLAPLSALISFFHFSRGVYQGFQMWIIITPPKHFQSKIGFSENSDCCYFKLWFVPILNRCSSWWDKPIFICILFMKLFQPLICLSRK